jgi:type IV secretory pathway VirJ component
MFPIPRIFAFVAAILPMFVATAMAASAVDSVQQAGSVRIQGALPDLKDLKLYEVRDADVPEGDWLVVLYTGDAGWTKFNTELAKRLNAAGFPLVGVDSLAYFWKARAPETGGADLGRIITAYAAAWHKHHVLLIGYSFGADVVSALANRVPPEDASLLDGVAIIGAALEAQFEIKIVGWLGMQSPGAPTAPEIERIRVPVLCIYGMDEKYTVCPKLTGSQIQKVELPGGHHMDEDYDAVAAPVLAMVTSLDRSEP